MDSYTSSPVSVQSGIDVGGNTNVAGQVVLDIPDSKPEQQPEGLDEVTFHFKRVADLLSKLNI